MPRRAKLPKSNPKRLVARLWAFIKVSLFSDNKKLFNLKFWKNYQICSFIITYTLHVYAIFPAILHVYAIFPPIFLPYIIKNHKFLPS